MPGFEAKGENFQISGKAPDLLDFEFEIVKTPPVKEISNDYYLQALAEKKIKEAEEALFRMVNPIEKIDWERVRKNRKYQYEDSTY
jgi:hypothetical protein